MTLAILQQNAFDKEDAYCSLERQIKQFQLINLIFDTLFDFKTHDEAREFFLDIAESGKKLKLYDV